MGLSRLNHNVLSYSLTLGSMIVFWALLRPSGEFGFHAKLTIGLWIFHFGKRILECLFIHKYSPGEVSWSDGAQEYFYYIFFSLMISLSSFYFSHHDLDHLNPLMFLGILIMVLAEAGNGYSHILLARLRSSGKSSQRRESIEIPRDCPHYLFEILAWGGFFLANQTWGSLFFLAGVTAILSLWSHERHQRYIKMYGQSYLKLGRSRLIPKVF